MDQASSPLELSNLLFKKVKGAFQQSVTNDNEMGGTRDVIYNSITNEEQSVTITLVLLNHVLLV